MKTIANHCPMLRCVIVLVLLLGTSPAFSQSQNKIVQWSGNHVGSYRPKTAPEVQWFSQIDGIEIQGFAVGGKSITLREPFAANDDWLRDFTVRVKNVSQESLMNVQLDVHLNQMTVPVQVVFCYPCTGKAMEKGKRILPGEEVNLIMLSGGYYDWVKKQIARKYSPSQITKAEIEIVIVSLPDGKRWESGCVKTFDPKNACPSQA